MDVGALIDHLVNPDAELKRSLLCKLSGLMPDDQEALRGAWPDVPAARRAAIVRGIVALADDHIELDFVPALRVALDDDDAEVRAAAAAGLWETDDRIVITPLVSMLEADESPEARASAATTLGHFVDLAEAGKLIKRDSTRLCEALRRALEDKQEEALVRRRALEALAPLAGRDITGWVRWAYACGDPAFRQSALYAMGRTCDPAWLPYVVDEMGSADPALRFEAANAARGIADPESLPHLHELVSDDDAQVAVAAVQAIGAVGGAVARKLLRRYVETGESYVSEAAEEALAAMDLDEMDFTMLSLGEEDE